MRDKDARKLHPAAQEAVRLRIAGFLHAQKGTQGEAAQIFQVSLACVKKTWKRFKQGGLKVLQARKRGPAKSTARLSKAQLKHITSALKKGIPDSCRLPYHLWTAGAVRLLIKKKPG